MRNGRIPKGIWRQASTTSSVKMASKFILKTKNIIRVISSNSLFIENYYLEASFVHVKKNFKGFLNIVIIYFCSSVCFDFVMDQRETLTLIFGLCCLIFYLHCYLAIFYISSYNHLERFHLFFTVVMFMSLLLKTQFPSPSSLELNVTPILQISLANFSNLQIDLHNSFILWIISFGFMILVFSYRMERHQDFFGAVVKTKNSSQNEDHDNGETSQHDQTFVIMSALIYFGISITLLFTYLYFLNTLYRKFSFKELGRHVQTKSQLKSAVKIQLNWIDAIMPKIVKDQYMEHTEEIKHDKWVYIKTFENVSILFADIVGFTALSSNKTATVIVSLLNELFNNFDDLCAATNCEKLGTLGDCYYCVSGCPIPRPGHAISCIEMGLGMCKIIIGFNEKHSEDVQMRVGIHTGRVNAAIIGKKRFRLDVYSNDVIIASAMESSGLPGRVHISETVFECVRNVYPVEIGDDLEVNREYDHGIAGMILKKTTIKTYFVDPESAHLQLDLTFSTTKTFRLLRVISKNISSLFNDTDPVHVDEIPIDINHMKTKMRKVDIKYIEHLHFDPQKRIELLSNLPITPILLKFRNNEIEWHFNLCCRNLVRSKTSTWLRLGPLIDSIICFLYSSLIYLGIFLLFSDLSRRKKLIFALHYFFSIFLIIFIFVQSSYVKSYGKYYFPGVIHFLFHHPFSRFIICLYFVYVPLIVIIIILNDCSKLYVDSNYTMKYFLLIIFTLFHVPLFISAHHITKIIVGIITTATGVFVFMQDLCVEENVTDTLHQHSCSRHTNVTDVSFYRMVRWNFIFQIVFSLIVFIPIIRNIETNVRLLFYIERDNEINNEEASNAKKKARELLYNIFPKYVFNQLINQPENKKEIVNFNYSTTVPNAAVVFACISNFFSKYYREDYKGGENALKLLHKIICNFDDLSLKDEKYKYVEKIKTINDCYMVASGLNPKQIKKTDKKNDHLVSLMYYALDLIKSLESFNEKFIIGNDKFEIKIGYNFGPVTAGIIGASKPMYDIWGDTVNVSSRMYSTGSPGKIQVPDYVCFEMNKEFNFKYRGKIFVKGKGDMSTYLCLGPLNAYEKILMNNRRSGILSERIMQSFYKNANEKLMKTKTEKYAERILNMHKVKGSKRKLSKSSSRLGIPEKRKLFVEFDIHE